MPVTAHVSPLVTWPEKLIPIEFPLSKPVNVPLPVPTPDENAKEPMRSDPAVAVPEIARLIVIAPVKVPVPVKIDPLWLPMFTAAESPMVPLFAGF